MFRDRSDAGRMLAAELAALRLQDPVVLALPRGGVPVAFEVAAALKAPLDLVIVRKVGAPGNSELALAAVVDGNPPQVVRNGAMVEAYGLSEEELEELVTRERPELARRHALYAGARHPLSVARKTVVLIDDGAATGATMKAAVRAPEAAGKNRRSPSGCLARSHIGFVPRGRHHHLPGAANTFSSIGGSLSGIPSARRRRGPGVDGES